MALTRPATKWSRSVASAGRVAATIAEALALAASGRPGPVLVQLPKDVQAAAAAPSRPGLPAVSPRSCHTGPARRIVSLFRAAKRPLIYAGGGVVNAGPHAAEALAQLARLTGAPVTTTLMGLGCFPAADPQWLGMPGMHGTVEANLAMHGCDLLLNVGARFDDRVTGQLDGFSPHSVKVHVDIDPSEIGKVVPVQVGVVGHAAEVLQAVAACWGSNPAPDLSGWWSTIADWRGRGCLAFTPRRDAILPRFRQVSGH